MQCPFHEWDCAFRPCEQHVFSPCVSSTPTPEQREWDTMLLYFAVAQRATRKKGVTSHTHHSHTTHTLAHSHSHTHTPLFGNGAAARYSNKMGGGRRQLGKESCSETLHYCTTLPYLLCTHHNLIIIIITIIISVASTAQPSIPHRQRQHQRKNGFVVQRFEILRRSEHRAISLMSADVRHVSRFLSAEKKNRLQCARTFLLLLLLLHLTHCRAGLTDE